MNGGTPQRSYEAVSRLREVFPTGITADLIVGFPGRRRRSFRKPRLIRRCLFDMHIFPYSPPELSRPCRISLTERRKGRAGTQGSSSEMKEAFEKPVGLVTGAAETGGGPPATLLLRQVRVFRRGFPAPCAGCALRRQKGPFRRIIMKAEFDIANCYTIIYNTLGKPDSLSLQSIFLSDRVAQRC